MTRKRKPSYTLPPHIAEAVVAMASTMTSVQIVDALAVRFNYFAEEARVRQYLKTQGMKARPAKREDWVHLRSCKAEESGNVGDLPLSRYPDYRGMTFTAMLFGDPPIGRRAIDKRSAQVPA